MGALGCLLKGFWDVVGSFKGVYKGFYKGSILGALIIRIGLWGQAVRKVTIPISS